MKHGFVKAAVISPKLRVADTEYNAQQICLRMKEAAGRGAKLIVFPELCLTGYTCQDLFLQETLLDAAKQALDTVAACTHGLDALVFVGLPLEREHKLYNVAAVLADGKVLAFIPKRQIPNYAEFYEARYFTQGNQEAVSFSYRGREVPFGTNILLECKTMPGLTVAIEICEDGWVADTPATAHAAAGASVIVNLSASDETVAKSDYRKMLVQMASARLLCGYLFASAGEGESTQDVVFSAHNLICENGTVLAESGRFVENSIYSDLDIHRLSLERRKMTTFVQEQKGQYVHVPFSLKLTETRLDRHFEQRPFVPEKQETREKRCEEILSIQSHGLKKRLEHTGCQSVVLGISGGLDSTLALLVCVRAFDMLKMDRKQIYAVTMPCFGTTNRTYENACALARTLGATLKEIPIQEAVLLHFRDIGQDKQKQDVTYENSQARERTQVLMDLANQLGGLVIGTGDMSELALGWATYNGDHMSMYGVNVGVPKTLVRHLVRFYADTCQQEELRSILLDVLDTPVSPELLPPAKGEISQVTEELVGPYELHDFFLYYMLRMGYAPAKVYRIAREAFAGQYEDAFLLKWLKVFYRRFFSQQFKRSCLPDGPKVGSVALSPRGDLRMPSDACVSVWMRELEELDA